MFIIIIQIYNAPCLACMAFLREGDQRKLGMKLGLVDRFRLAECQKPVTVETGALPRSRTSTITWGCMRGLHDRHRLFGTVQICKYLALLY